MWILFGTLRDISWNIRRLGIQDTGPSILEYLTLSSTSHFASDKVVIRSSNSHGCIMILLIWFIYI